MADEPNTCLICLEPLSAGSIGTTVPCGHCFHEKCFQGWERSRSSSSCVKCPSCNRDHVQFIKVYIDFENIKTVTLDADDVSTSSSSDESQGSRNDKSATCGKPLPEVVDLVSEPALSAPAVNNRHDQLVKYKRKYKCLKRRIQQLEKKTKKLGDQRRQWIDEKEQLEQKCSEFEEEVIDLNGLRLKDTLELERLRFKEIQLEKQCTLTKTRLQACEKLAEEATSELKAIKEIHAAEIEKVQLSSMSEVRRMASDYPKVLLENRSLKEKIQRLESSVGSMRDGKQLYSRGLEQQEKTSKRKRRAFAEEVFQAFKNDNTTFQTKSKAPNTMSGESRTIPTRVTAHSLRFQTKSKAKSRNPLELIEKIDEKSMTQHQLSRSEGTIKTKSLPSGGKSKLFSSSSKTEKTVLTQWKSLDSAPRIWP